MKVIIEIEVDISVEDLRDLVNNIKDKIGGHVNLDFAEIDHFLNIEERKHVISEIRKESLVHPFEEDLTIIRLKAL